MRIPQLAGKVEGVPRFNRALEGLADDFEDNQPALEEVAERGFYPLMQTVFETEGRGRWQGLQPEYARRKREIYGDKPILQASGSLIRSLTKKGARGNVHLRVGPDTLLLGSELPHARRQDQDRPILHLTERDVDDLADVAQESMRDRADNRGFETR